MTMVIESNYAADRFVMMDNVSKDVGGGGIAFWTSQCPLDLFNYSLFIIPDPSDQVLDFVRNRNGHIRHRRPHQDLPLRRG